MQSAHPITVENQSSLTLSVEHKEGVEALISQAIKEKDQTLLKTVCDLYKDASLPMDPIVVKCHVIYLAINLELDIQSELEKWENHLSTNSVSENLNHYLLDCYIKPAYLNKDIIKLGKIYRSLNESLSFFSCYDIANDKNKFNKKLQIYLNLCLKTCITTFNNERKEIEKDISGLDKYIIDYLWIIDEIPKNNTSSSSYCEVLSIKYRVYMLLLTYIINSHDRTNQEFFNLCLKISEFDAIDDSHFFNKGTLLFSYCEEKWLRENNLAEAADLEERQSMCKTAIDYLRKSLKSPKTNYNYSEYSPESISDLTKFVLKDILMHYIIYEIYLNKGTIFNSIDKTKFYNNFISFFNNYASEFKNEEIEIRFNILINSVLEILFKQTDLKNISDIYHEIMNIVDKLLNDEDIEDKAIKDYFLDFVKTYYEAYSKYLELYLEFQNAIENENIEDCRMVASKTNEILLLVQKSNPDKYKFTELQRDLLFIYVNIYTFIAYHTKEDRDIEETRNAMWTYNTGDTYIIFNFDIFCKYRSMGIKIYETFPLLEDLKNDFINIINLNLYQTNENVHIYLNNNFFTTILGLLTNQIFKNKIPYDNNKSLSENILCSIQILEKNFMENDYANDQKKRKDLFLLIESILELLEGQLLTTFVDLYIALVKKNLNNIKNFILDDNDLDYVHKSSLFHLYLERYNSIPDQFIEIKLALLNDAFKLATIPISANDIKEISPDKLLERFDENEVNRNSEDYQVFSQSFENLNDKIENLITYSEKYFREKEELESLITELTKHYISIKQIDRELTSQETFIKIIKKFDHLCKTIALKKEMFHSTCQNCYKANEEYGKALTLYETEKIKFNQFKENKEDSASRVEEKIKKEIAVETKVESEEAAKKEESESVAIFNQEEAATNQELLPELKGTDLLISFAIRDKQTRYLKKVCDFYKNSSLSRNDAIVVKCHIIYMAIKLNLDIQKELEKWEDYLSKNPNQNLNVYLLNHFIKPGYYQKDPIIFGKAYRALKDALFDLACYDNDTNFNKELKDYCNFQTDVQILEKCIRTFNREIINYIDNKIINQEIINDKEKEILQDDLMKLEKYISDYLWIIDEIPEVKTNQYRKLLDIKYHIYQILVDYKTITNPSINLDSLFLAVSEFDAVNETQLYMKGASVLAYCETKWIAEDLSDPDVLRSRQSMCRTAINILKEALNSSDITQGVPIALVRCITLYFNYELLLSENDIFNTLDKSYYYEIYKNELKYIRNRRNYKKCTLDFVISKSCQFIFINTNFNNMENIKKEIKETISKLLNGKLKEEKILKSKFLSCVDDFSKLYSNFQKLKLECHDSRKANTVKEYEKLTLEINKFIADLDKINLTQKTIQIDYLKNEALFIDVNIQLALAYLTRENKNIERAKKSLSYFNKNNNIIINFNEYCKYNSLGIKFHEIIPSLEIIKKSFHETSTEPAIYNYLTHYLLNAILMLTNQNSKKINSNYDENKSLSDNILINVNIFKEDFKDKKLDCFLVIEAMLELIEDTNLKEKYIDLYNNLIINQLDNIKYLLSDETTNNEAKSYLCTFYIGRYNSIAYDENKNKVDYNRILSNFCDLIKTSDSVQINNLIDDAINRFPHEKKFYIEKIPLLEDTYEEAIRQIDNEESTVNTLPDKLKPTNKIELNSSEYKAYSNAYTTLDSKLNIFSKLCKKYIDEKEKLGKLSQEINDIYKSINQIDIKKATSDDIINLKNDFKKFNEKSKAIAEQKKVLQSTKKSLQSLKTDVDNALIDCEKKKYAFNEFIANKGTKGPACTEQAKEAEAKKLSPDELKKTETDKFKKTLTSEIDLLKVKFKEIISVDNEAFTVSTVPEKLNPEKNELQFKEYKAYLKAYNILKDKLNIFSKHHKKYTEDKKILYDIKSRYDKIVEFDIDQASYNDLSNLKNDVKKFNELTKNYAQKKSKFQSSKQDLQNAKISFDQALTVCVKEEKAFKERKKAEEKIATEEAAEKERKEVEARRAEEEAAAEKERKEAEARKTEEEAAARKVEEEKAIRKAAEEVVTKPAEEPTNKTPTEAKKAEEEKAIRKAAEEAVTKPAEESTNKTPAEAKKAEEEVKAKEKAEEEVNKVKDILLNGAGSPIKDEDIANIYKLHKDLANEGIKLIIKGSFAARLAIFLYNPNNREIAKYFSIHDIDLVIPYHPNNNSKNIGKIRSLNSYVIVAKETKDFVNVKRAKPNNDVGIDLDLTVQKSSTTGKDKFIPFHFIHLEIIEKDEIKDDDKIVQIGDYYFKLCIEEGKEKIVENACKFTEFLVCKPEDQFNYYSYNIFKYLLKSSDCTSNNMCTSNASVLESNSNLLSVDNIHNPLLDYYIKKLQAVDARICYEEMKKFAIGIPVGKEHLARPFIQDFYLSLLLNVVKFQKEDALKRGYLFILPTFKQLYEYASECANHFINNPDLVKNACDPQYGFEKWKENIDSIAIKKLDEYKETQEYKIQKDRYPSSLIQEHQRFQQFLLQQQQELQQFLLQQQQTYRYFSVTQGPYQQTQGNQEFLLQQQQELQQFLLQQQQSYLYFCYSHGAHQQTQGNPEFLPKLQGQYPQQQANQLYRNPMQVQCLTQQSKQSQDYEQRYQQNERQQQQKNLNQQQNQSQSFDSLNLRNNSSANTQQQLARNNNPAVLFKNENQIKNENQRNRPQDDRQDHTFPKRGRRGRRGGK